MNCTRLFAVREIAVPPESGVHPWAVDADFTDAFAVDLQHGEDSALELYLRIIARVPVWVRRAIQVRNLSVSLAGLETAQIEPTDPTKAADSYRVGDRIGVFQIEGLSKSEVLLLARDRHLDSRGAITLRDTKTGHELIWSSAVRIHNLLGRAYMLPVWPGHKLVVRSMLANAML